MTKGLFKDGKLCYYIRHELLHILLGEIASYVISN